MNTETDVIDVEATTTALTPRPSGSPLPSMDTLVTMGDSEIEGVLAKVGRAANAMQRISLVAVREFTQGSQWAAFGDKAHLMGSGAMALCRLGIDVAEPIFEEHWERGDVFVDCCVHATWRWANLSVTEIGSRSSCDDFWGTEERGTLKRFTDAAKADPKKARLMLRGHVRKAAHENAMSRAVQGILGLRGLTVAQLQESTGIVPGSTTTFKTSGKTDKATGKTDSKTVTVKKCLTLAVGSKDLGVRGIVTGVVPKPKHLAVHIQGADGSQLLVKWWTGEDGTAMQPDWLQTGICIFFSDLHIKEYKGARDYQANHAEPVELPGTNGDQEGGES